MQIPFSAFANDCTVTGELALQTDRLSDFLANSFEFEVEQAALRALDDGHVVRADAIDILRDDLCCVAATGPRGHAARRVWTRQHPVRAEVGPYVVIGYLHVPPTVDPLGTVERRKIVALTECVVGYLEAGSPVQIEADAVLLNSAKIDRLDLATDEDVVRARGGRPAVH